MHRCLSNRILLALAWLVLGCCQAAAETLAGILEVEPAWDGYVRVGADTELRIRLSGSPGPFSVQITGAAAGNTRLLTGELTADGAAELLVPLAKVQADTLRIARLDSSQTPAQTAALELIPTTTFMVAALQSEPVATSPGIRVIPLAPGALPVHAASYGTVDALILDPAALQQLDATRFPALQDYVGACGALVFVGVDPSLSARIREHAGCDGRRIGFAADAAAAPEVLQAVLHDAAPQPPGYRSLLSLLPAGAGTGWLLAAGMLALYVFAAGAGLWARVRLAGLLAISGLMTLVLGLLAFPDTRNPKWVSWSLLESARVPALASTGIPAQYRAVSRLESDSGGMATLTVPADAPEPVVLTDRAYASVTHLRTGNRQLRLEQPLFQRRTVTVRGITRVRPPLHWRYEADGVELTNTSTVTSLPARLVVRGEQFLVPALPPGTHWRPPAEPDGWTSAPLDRLLRAQSMRLPAALLLQTDPGSTSSPPFPGPGLHYLLVTL